MVADNRKARFNYFIDETFEAELALSGTKPNRYASYADACGPIASILRRSDHAS